MTIHNKKIIDILCRQREISPIVCKIKKSSYSRQSVGMSLKLSGMIVKSIISHDNKICAYSKRRSDANLDFPVLSTTFQLTVIRYCLKRSDFCANKPTSNSLWFIYHFITILIHIGAMEWSPDRNFLK